jgi:hypothetical protein
MKIRAQTLLYKLLAFLGYSVWAQAAVLKGGDSCPAIWEGDAAWEFEGGDTPAEESAAAPDRGLAKVCPRRSSLLQLSSSVRWHGAHQRLPAPLRTNLTNFTMMAPRSPALAIGSSPPTDLPLGNPWGTLPSRLSDLAQGARHRLAVAAGKQRSQSALSVTLFVLFVLILCILVMAVLMLQKTRADEPMFPTERRPFVGSRGASSPFPTPVGGSVGSSDSTGGIRTEWRSPFARRSVPSPEQQGAAVVASPQAAKAAAPAAVGAAAQQVTLTPEMSEAPPSSSKYLCPGLVVPQGSQCVVAVRILEAPAHTTFYVYDMQGTPFVQVEVAPPVWVDSPGATKEEKPIVVLRIAHGTKPVIAYCKTGSEYGGRRSVYIYDAFDELFGHVIKVMKFSQMRAQVQGSDRPSGSGPAAESSRLRYVFTSGRVGLQLVFDGNFQKHAINITDDKNKVVANAEPCTISFDPSGAYYKLRVTEATDVGIILCALLAISLMELPSA